ncbi:hypothetical protein ECANGB1_134 [Enterospora canceri]|uniref:BRCA2 OB1 domain-containing protein n=1 Tax=Enterospora canceri TaxID=1081671 RepID=A0A1Y1S8C3_9MICR|nr:hypothetical protein ECANGB1_134 [Enterospora canceri]
MQKAKIEVATAQSDSLQDERVEWDSEGNMSTFVEQEESDNTKEESLSSIAEADFSEIFFDNLEPAKAEQFATGFVTGNNKSIHVDQEKIKEAEEKLELNKENISNNNSRKEDETPNEASTFTGFCTGNNKRIKVGSSRIQVAEEQPKGAPIRKYNSPQRGHFTQVVRDEIKMMELYETCRQIFSKKPLGWIREQFKWIWLHFVLNPIDYAMLRDEMIRMMNFRVKNEQSFFRGVLETSIPPFKYCVLGILGIKKETVELFDGYYSLVAEIDSQTHAYLKHADFGSKIHVFGMELLVNGPCDILETNRATPILRLSYNSVRLCHTHHAIGFKNKIAFMRKLNEIRQNGGVVPAIEVTISRVVDELFLVVVGNYRVKTGDLEGEFDKIRAMAEKAKKEIRAEDVVVRRFATVVVEDDSTSALLTWWNPPEIRANETYRIVHTAPRQSSSGLHLNTTRKSFYQRI